MVSFIGVIASNNVSRALSLNTNHTYCRLVQIRTVSSLSVQCKKCYRRRISYVKESVSRTVNLSFFRCLSGLKRQEIVLQRQTYGTAKTLNDPNLQDLFPLYFMYVRTNITFWEEYPEGLQFDVGYVDTKLRKDASISDRKPIILALPSSVGNHMELTGILMTFAKLGYRVVIPNLPGSSFCRGRSKQDEAVCQFSVQEKADFVKDFLKELGITKVDMLVTNSCSVYTGVSLCVFHTSLFKSLVMINPTGLQPTHVISKIIFIGNGDNSIFSRTEKGSMLPLWVHKKFTAVYDGRYMLQGLFKGLVTGIKTFTQKRHWQTINVVTHSRSIAALSFSDAKVCGEYLKARTVPRYAIFGEDSETMDVKSTMEYMSLLNIPQSAITELDEDNKIVKQGTPCEGNYGLYIRGNRSDDIMQTRTVALRRELLNILKSICPDL